MEVNFLFQVAIFANNTYIYNQPDDLLSGLIYCVMYARKSKFEDLIPKRQVQGQPHGAAINLLQLLHVHQSHVKTTNRILEQVGFLNIKNSIYFSVSLGIFTCFGVTRAIFSTQCIVGMYFNDKINYLPPNTYLVQAQTKHFSCWLQGKNHI